jgi:hypothetical protein
LKKFLLLILIAIYPLTGKVAAQSDHSGTEQDEEHATEVHHEMNHLLVFVGGTAMLEKKGTYFSLGLDYLHILSPARNWGAGGFAEVIFAKHPEWLFGGLIYYQFKNQLFIRTGPGIEILKHEETDPTCGCTHTKSQTEFLYRIGLGYNYHTKLLIFAPTVDLDIVRSATALVYGLNVGLAF